jgi:hypothetical protein
MVLNSVESEELLAVAEAVTVLLLTETGEAVISEDEVTFAAIFTPRMTDAVSVVPEPSP